MTRWRDIAQGVIADVRDAHPEAEGDELRDLLRLAYPFQIRKYWPYRVWLDEVHIACDGRTPAHRRSSVARWRRNVEQVGQRKLWEKADDP